MEEMNTMMEVVTEDYCEEGENSKGLGKVLLIGATVVGGTVLLVKKGVPKLKAWNQKRKDKKAGIVTEVVVENESEEN